MNTLTASAPIGAAESSLAARLSALAVGAGLMCVANGAVDVLCPLWIVDDLKLSAGDWAGLRSLRFTGTFFGIAAVALVARSLGARRLGVFALLISGLALAGIAQGLLAAKFLFPLFGAAISATFVANNVLTQAASSSRQGLSNGVYRSAGALAAIIAAPFALMMAHMVGGAGAALLIMALILAIAGACLATYPGDRATGGSVRESIAHYLSAMRQRRLTGLILADTLLTVGLGPLFAFLTIRFMRELDFSSGSFARMTFVVGTFALVGTFFGGWLAERVRFGRLMAFSWLSAMAGVALVGFDQPSIATIGYALAATGPALALPATSMQIGRLGGEVDKAAVFVWAKTVQAAAIAVSMQILARLEPVCGIPPLLWCGAAFGTITLAIWLRLQQPLAQP